MQLLPALPRHVVRNGEPVLAYQMRRNKPKQQGKAETEGHAADQAKNRVMGIKFWPDHLNHPACCLLRRTRGLLQGNSNLSLRYWRLQVALDRAD